MLQIRNLRKSFGDLQVLKSIDLDVNKGDVVAILGPSGSGKTTMLRCLNFLEKSDGGTMLFDARQDVHAGASGCGCSAAVLCALLLDELNEGRMNRIVFAGTGALMSPTSVQQGESIPAVCHAVVLESGKGER